MATCEDCNREMLLAASCTAVAVELANERFRRIPYRPPRGSLDPTGRCHDCGVRPGGFHHFGCDMERCPRCGGQLFCCDCWDDGTDEDDDTDEELFVVGVEGLEPPTSAL
jgi:hypothetical protein